MSEGSKQAINIVTSAGGTLTTILGAALQSVGYVLAGAATGVSGALLGGIGTGMAIGEAGAWDALAQHWYDLSYSDRDPAAWRRLFGTAHPNEVLDNLNQTIYKLNQKSLDLEEVPITKITYPDGTVYYPEPNKWDFPPEVVTRSAPKSIDIMTNSGSRSMEHDEGGYLRQLWEAGNDPDLETLPQMIDETTILSTTPELDEWSPANEGGYLRRLWEAGSDPQSEDFLPHTFLDPNLNFEADNLDELLEYLDTVPAEISDLDDFAEDVLDPGQTFGESILDELDDRLDLVPGSGISDWDDFANDIFEPGSTIGDHDFGLNGHLNSDIDIRDSHSAVFDSTNVSETYDPVSYNPDAIEQHMHHQSEIFENLFDHSNTFDNHFEQDSFEHDLWDGSHGHLDIDDDGDSILDGFGHLDTGHNGGDNLWDGFHGHHINHGGVGDGGGVGGDYSSFQPGGDSGGGFSSFSTLSGGPNPSSGNPASGQSLNPLNPANPFSSVTNTGVSSGGSVPGAGGAGFGVGGPGPGGGFGGG